MKLGKPETFSIFYHHHRSVGIIDPDLDHRSGYQHIRPVLREILKDPLLLALLHLSMKCCDPYGGSVDLPQIPGIGGHRLQFHTLRVLDLRTDHIGLVSVFHFFSDKLIGCGAIIRPHHTVQDLLSSSRQLRDQGNVQIRIQNDRQGPRDRRRTHNKHMRQISLLRQTFPLAYPEPVLFIRHYQAQ